jgi:hypothetical protein
MWADDGELADIELRYDEKLAELGL